MEAASKIFEKEDYPRRGGWENGMVMPREVEFDTYTTVHELFW